MSPYAPWWVIAWRLFWWPAFALCLIGLATVITIQYGRDEGKRLIREIGWGF